MSAKKESKEKKTDNELLSEDKSIDNVSSAEESDRDLLPDDFVAEETDAPPSVQDESTEEKDASHFTAISKNEQRKKRVFTIVFLLLLIAGVYVAVKFLSPEESIDNVEVEIVGKENLDENAVISEEMAESDQAENLNEGEDGENSSILSDILDFDPTTSVDLRDLSYFERRIEVVPVRLDEVYVFDEDDRGAHGVAFNPSDNHEMKTLVASGGWSNDLYLWDFLTKEIRYKVDEAHDSDIMSVKFSTDGRYIFSAGLDNKIKVWETDTGRLIRTFGPYQESVIGMDIYESREKILLAAALLNGGVLLIDFYADKLMHTFEHKPYATSVKFDFDGRLLASTGKDGKVRLWDAVTYSQVRVFDHGGKKKIEEYDGIYIDRAKVNCVAFDPLGEYIVSGGWDNKVKMWDISTGELIFTFDAHINAIETVLFDPDGNFVIVGARDGFVSVWEASTGRGVAGYDTGAERVYNVTFDAYGELLAVAGYDHTVRIYYMFDEADIVEE